MGNNQMHKFTIQIFYSDTEDDFIKIVTNTDDPNSNEIFEAIGKTGRNMKEILAIGALFHGWVEPIGYVCAS